jgi:hypothetical protein
MKDRHFAPESASNRAGAGGDAQDLATDAATLVDYTEDEGLPDLFYLNDLEADDHESGLDELGY